MMDARVGIPVEVAYLPPVITSPAKPRPKALRRRYSGRGWQARVIGPGSPRARFSWPPPHYRPCAQEEVIGAERSVLRVSLILSTVTLTASSRAARVSVLEAIWVGLAGDQEGHADDKRSMVATMARMRALPRRLRRREQVNRGTGDR